MITQTMTIREAKPEDVDEIYATGIIQGSFAVSPKTRFFEKGYLRDWIRHPNNDVLLVAEIENEVVGFLFCRINRNAWAMLENIAVSTSKREQGIGTALLDQCFKRLQMKGIGYIAGLVREGNKGTEFFMKKGFSPGNTFVWIEQHVPGNTLGANDSG